MERFTRIDVDRRRGPFNNEVAMYKRAGARVARWRQQNGDVSQLELAKRAGVSVGCLQTFETGTRATRDTNLRKIADAVGVSVAELMGDKDPFRTAADRRAEGLSEEDLTVARLFHDAITDVRIAVKEVLVAGAVPQPISDADRALLARLQRQGPEFRAALEASLAGQEESNPPAADPALAPDVRVAGSPHQRRHD